jgi:hypothetical protein
MFVGDEVLLEVSFPVARARLARLAEDGLLHDVSSDAYDRGITGSLRVGPLGSMPVLSKVVTVHSRALADRPDQAGMAVRWEATGAGGALFPALDADIVLTPAQDGRTLLSLAGAYRPPMGPVGAGLDRAVLGHVASATIRFFVRELGNMVADVDAAAEPARGFWQGPAAPELA